MKTFSQRRYPDGLQVNERCSVSLSSWKCKSNLQWAISSYLLKWLLPKNKKFKRWQRMWEKRKLLNTTGENVSWCSNYGKQYGGFLEKLKNRTTILFINSIYEYLSEKNQNQSQKDIWTPMFITELFAITKRRKQDKCPSLDEWIKKMSHTLTHTHRHTCTHTEKERNVIHPLKQDNFCRWNINGPWGDYAKGSKL